jgi:hypothetical protein
LRVITEPDFSETNVPEYGQAFITWFSHTDITLFVDPNINYFTSWQIFLGVLKFYYGRNLRMNTIKMVLILVGYSMRFPRIIITNTKYLITIGYISKMFKTGVGYVY